jgi:putative membrane protein
MPGAPTDHLANERTFLAWVRTAITIMAFGFVVARFGLFLKEISGTGSGQTSPVSQGLGVFLVLAGTVILVVSQLRFRRVRTDLLDGRFTAREDLEWVLTALLVAVGAGLALYLLGVL